MKKISFDDLNKKVCVITGGAGTIGSAIADALVLHGVKVAVIDIRKPKNSKVLSIEADILNKKSLTEAKKEINKKFGKIDFLINCAGGNNPKATTEDEFVDKNNLKNLNKTFFGMETDGIKKVFDLNFTGTLLPVMVFAKDMVEKQRGVVLNISSMNSFRPLTRIPAYSAAKASVNNFTQWLAVHFAKVNVRVNAIAPGFILTEQNRYLLMDKNKLTKRGEKIITNTPMGKFGKPEDLIGTIIYLLSNSSQFVTGTIIPVDGGFNAYSGV